MIRAAARAAVASFAIAVAFGGCSGIGADGVDPPVNRLFYPSALTLDATSRWLIVVNSNSDLRFNRGTIAAVDLQQVARDRAIGNDWPVCPAPRYVPLSLPVLNCCRDVIDQRVLNCDERRYIDPGATVRTGSFGAGIVKQPYQRGGQNVERLFVGVRSDPSVTFVDSWTDPEGRVHLRCAGPFDAPTTASPPAGHECEDAWRVENGVRGTEPLRLPEEPFDLAFDATRGVVYGAHLFTGVSVIDACGPELGRRPALTWVQRALFPNTPGQGVTALSLPPQGDQTFALYATARSAPEVATLVLQGTAANADACTSAMAPARPLSLVASTMPLVSNAFSPGGLDVRGFALDPGAARGYLLHRNTSRGPSAVVRFDLRPNARGDAAFTPLDSVEVCSGPTQLVSHDAGRGRRFFVPCFEAGQLYVIDPDRMGVEAIVDLGRGPTRVAFDPADPTIAYVAGFTDNNVAVVDLRLGSPTEYRVVQRIGFPRPATVR